MATVTKARILKAGDLAKRRPALPKTWTEAAGILKGKKGIHPVRCQRQIRKRWDTRLKKLAV